MKTADILIRNIGAKDYALFYQELANVVGEHCYSFEIVDDPNKEIEKVIDEMIGRADDEPENNGWLSALTEVKEKLRG